ncbi:hypothetical protein J3U76_12750 [Oceanisphaera sp. DM8]|uniref:Uncharacterized protein n=1 Tax=Oceanisphaera pacifica TaxID=2818389 RepID=A0ABS3NJM7_9GAMM|nr:hypothetical protein [Oceanisphaera pacifica]
MVAGMCRELRLPCVVNSIIPKQDERHVSHG